MWQEANKEDNYECYHHLADLLIMSINWYWENRSMDLIERNVIKKKKKSFHPRVLLIINFSFRFQHLICTIISLHIFNLQILFLISFYHTALSWKQIEIDRGNVTEKHCFFENEYRHFTSRKIKKRDNGSSFEWIDYFDCVFEWIGNRYRLNWISSTRNSKPVSKKKKKKLKFTSIDVFI